MPIRLLRSVVMLVCLACIAGCGAGGVGPNPDGSFNIVPSSAIQTGNWSIEQPLNSSGSPTFFPIGAFYGGITADGNRVQGQFTVGSTDGNGQISRCLYDGISTVFLTGEAKDGKLTLDGTFEANTVHLEGQLSADRKSILSGSYSVSGRCATPTAPVAGHWNPPLTGTYSGTSVSNAGNPVLITVTATQQDRYFGSGYFPVEGTITIASSSCTVKAPMLSAFLVGPFSQLIGYTAQNEGDNVRLYGTEDDLSQTISLDDWEYYDDPICGTDFGNPYAGAPIVLTKQ